MLFYPTPTDDDRATDLQRLLLRAWSLFFKTRCLRKQPCRPWRRAVARSSSAANARNKAPDAAAPDHAGLLVEPDGAGLLGEPIPGET